MNEQETPTATPGVDLNITEHIVDLIIGLGTDETGKDKKQTFSHKLKPQDRGDVISLLTVTGSERSVKAGQRTRTQYGNPDALRKFWRRYHAGVKGYPGAEDWREVPEDKRADWHPRHQVLAVSRLLDCEARVLDCEMTFDGGVWRVATAVPNFNTPAFVITFTVNEWGEKLASKIEKDALDILSDSGGQETTLNVALYVQALIDLTRRVDGAHIAGEDWEAYGTSEGRKVEFLKRIYPAWVYQAAFVLFNHWLGERRD